MSRLIDADELVTILDEELQKDSSLSKVLLVGFAKQILNDAPTVDAEPVRHGRWVNHLSENGATDGIFCSRCDYEIERYSRPNYCPNCGAKMDEVTE